MARTKEINSYYRGFTWLQALLVVATIIAFNAVVFYHAPIKIPLIPRSLEGLGGVWAAHFFHGSEKHLLGNMLAFGVYGLWALKVEGKRGLKCIAFGVIFAGVLLWLFSPGKVLGFSTAVFACYGVIFVWTLRKDWVGTAIFLFSVSGLHYILPDILDALRSTFPNILPVGISPNVPTFYDLITPSEHAEENKISWMGHLFALLGGMIGQIKSRRVALEILLEEDKVTDTEFSTIAARIHDDKGAKEEEAAAPPKDKMAIHFAAQEGKTKSVLYLVKKGAAGINAKDIRGFTPMHYAAVYGQTETVLALVKAGGDINAGDVRGFTPMHYAAANGQTETMLALVKEGADIGAKANGDWMPLHIAASEDETKAALALVKEGADLYACTDDGQTPMAIAIQKHGKDSEIARTLQNAAKKQGGANRQKAEEPPRESA